MGVKLRPHWARQCTRRTTAGCRPDLSRHKEVTAAPILHCTAALLHCTATLLYYFTAALHCCTVVLLQCCTALHCCILALLHCCTALQWCTSSLHCTAALLHCYTALHCCTAALLHCCTSALCCNIALMYALLHCYSIALFECKNGYLRREAALKVEAQDSWPGYFLFVILLTAPLLSQCPQVCAVHALPCAVQ